MNTKKCVEKWKSGNFRVSTNRALVAKKCGFPLIVPLRLRHVEKWKRIKSLSTSQRSKLAEGLVTARLDAVRGFPAVQDHTDGGTFDGLVLACTEFDEIAGGELLRKECEE